MADYNPYAPPKEDAAPFGSPNLGGGARTPDLAAALVELNEHVADPLRAGEDDRRTGPRVRVAGWIILAIGTVSGLAAVGVWLTMASDTMAFLLMFGFFGFLFLVLGGALIGTDLRLEARFQPGLPDKALRSFFYAMMTGRLGYALACLSPSARRQTLVTPDLAPVVTGPVDSFTVGTEQGLRRYAQTFCRPGHGQLHFARVTRLTSLGVEGDVAQVEAEIVFQSWPRWASVVSVVLFVAIRLVGIVVGAALYYGLRKRRSVRLRKTMLRGPNGRWYLYDASIVEGLT